MQTKTKELIKDILQQKKYEALYIAIVILIGTPIIINHYKLMTTTQQTIMIGIITFIATNIYEAKMDTDAPHNRAAVSLFITTLITGGYLGLLTLINLAP